MSTKRERLQKFVKEYNAAEIGAHISESVDICIMFDLYAREHGLKFMEDYICPPFQEHIIYKLTSKEVI